MSDPTTGAGETLPPEGAGITLPGNVRLPAPGTPVEPAPIGVLDDGTPVTAADLRSMNYYEARVEVLVRRHAPTDTYGEGGTKLAHARASTQAPTFADAVTRLDSDLAGKWRQILENAALVDQEPDDEAVAREPDASRADLVLLCRIMLLGLVAGWVWVAILAVLLVTR